MSPHRTETKVMGASLRSRQEFAPVDTNSSCLFSPSFLLLLSIDPLGCYCPPGKGNGSTRHRTPAGCSFTEKGILRQFVKRYNFKTPFLKGKKKSPRYILSRIHS